MSLYEQYFLKNYSYFSYVYIISKLEKYNKYINEKFDDIKEPLYEGKPNFNKDLLNEIMNEQFLDHNKLKCITMMIEYMLYWTSKNISIDDKDKRFNFLKYFMGNVNQVITNMVYKDIESSHGFVVFSDFINLKNKLVIKTPKDKEESRNILFEYYIGYNFINKLRLKTPNFMYTYGIFMCNPILKNTSFFSTKPQMKINTNFCKDTLKDNVYLLLEKIEGITLHQFIQEITTEEQLDIVVNIILQIILSLDIAQKEGEYCHNDLHTDNIMLKKINSPLSFEYLIGTNKYKMNYQHIATIIDYGMNRFIENNIPLGVTTLNTYDIHPFKNTISSDLFKVLFTTIFSILVLTIKKPNVYSNLNKKIDEVINFLISFFRDKYKNNIINEWDEYYLKNRNKNNFETFKNNFINKQKTYYYPETRNLEFLNTATPDNFISFVKENMPNVWNKHIIENKINENEMISAYNKVFDPNSNQEDFDDYLFYKCYNNSIYLYDFVEQKKIFYNLFNKPLSFNFTKDCISDQYSMILNFNNIKDCKNIIQLFNSKNEYKNEYKIIEDFEKENIKYIKSYYKNDIENHTYYISEMEKIYKDIDNNLLSFFRRKDFVKISMEFFNEDMKKQIRLIHDYIKIFEKYLLLTSFSIDLKNIADKYLSNHQYSFDTFLPKIKYYEIALVLSDCLQKYYKVINEFYSIRILEETNKQNIDYFTLYNLSVILQNLNPHFKDIYNNFINSFVNIKQKDSNINIKHYLPVNSDKQFLTYLLLGNYNTQMYQLTNLISRFVNYSIDELKNIFKINPDSELSDLIIYNELRKKRKIKDPSLKVKRNRKRGEEVCNFIITEKKKLGLPYGGDQYFHLDYGGNDGSVSSEIAKILKLDKTQVFSADVETWLGNIKTNLHDNITYTMLSENQRLPYNANSFDSVSCLQVLHHVEFMDFYIKELHRILKPGGILVIKEHDCINATTQLLIDIEHIIHEYVEPEIPNVDILNRYVAFYKSFTELNKLLQKNGFEFISDNYNFDTRINPTRYYFAIYKKK